MRRTIVGEIMPLFYYKCATCATVTRKILDKSLPEVDCACGGKMTRDAKGGSSQVMETLDNGIMAKSVTRLADAERLHIERGIDKPPDELI